MSSNFTPTALSDDINLTTQEQRNMLLSLLDSFAESPIEDLWDFFDHVRFDIGVISKIEDLPDAWCAHYLVAPGYYDVERAFTQLVTWGPVAERAAYLRMQRDQGNGQG